MIRGAAILFAGALVAAPLPSPLSPADAQKAFEVVPGLYVELVAAEPLVASPCAIAFDTQGRLFVAENRGYPIGPKEGRSPRASSPCLRIPMATDRWTSGPSSRMG